MFWAEDSKPLTATQVDPPEPEVAFPSGKAQKAQVVLEGSNMRRLVPPKIMTHKIIYTLLAIFCFQHLIRDHLQDEGVKDWYTTVGHSWFSFIPDTPRNNHIGMIILFLLGCVFVYLAFHK